jgi:hypothetical protein
MSLSRSELCCGARLAFVDPNLYIDMKKEVHFAFPFFILGCCFQKGPVNGKLICCEVIVIYFVTCFNRFNVYLLLSLTP